LREFFAVDSPVPTAPHVAPMNKSPNIMAEDSCTYISFETIVQARMGTEEALTKGDPEQAVPM
jgi:hypothetical protein